MFVVVISNLSINVPHTLYSFLKVILVLHGACSGEAVGQVKERMCLKGEGEGEEEEEECVL